MMERNKNHSSSYQSIYCEVLANPQIINDLSCSLGFIYKMQPTRYCEEQLDLKEKLATRMWKIIDDGLTIRQNQVVKLYIKGLTQNEIAKELGINQTSVHKVLHGNIDYRNPNGKRRYGGAFKKIMKLCQMDEEIQDILSELQELNNILEL